MYHDNVQYFISPKYPKQTRHTDINATNMFFMKKYYRGIFVVATLFL